LKVRDLQDVPEIHVIPKSLRYFRVPWRKGVTYWIPRKPRHWRHRFRTQVTYRPSTLYMVVGDD
jgi:hypothetical protein